MIYILVKTLTKEHEGSWETVLGYGTKTKLEAVKQQKEQQIKIAEKAIGEVFDSNEKFYNVHESVSLGYKRIDEISKKHDIPKSIITEDFGIYPWDKSIYHVPEITFEIRQLEEL